MTVYERRANIAQRPVGHLLVLALAVAGLLMLMAAAYLSTVAGLVAFLAIGGVVMLLAWRPPPGPGFGQANAITLCRAVLLVGLVALLIDFAGTTSSAWLITGLALLILALDGLDGLIARRFGECSSWGARFDMEVDAAFIMVLCIGLWLHQLAPVWVLLIGALRYFFVLAGHRWTWLERPLPESFRRKLVCVVQLGALILALSPLPLDGWRGALLGAALLSLLFSFASDIRWLHQRRFDAADLSHRTRSSS